MQHHPDAGKTVSTPVVVTVDIRAPRTLWGWLGMRLVALARWLGVRIEVSKMEAIEPGMFGPHTDALIAEHLLRHLDRSRARNHLPE